MIKAMIKATNNAVGLDVVLIGNKLILIGHFSRSNPKKVQLTAPSILKILLKLKKGLKVRIGKKLSLLSNGKNTNLWFPGPGSDLILVPSGELIEVLMSNFFIMVVRGST